VFWDRDTAPQTGFSLAAVRRSIGATTRRDLDMGAIAEGFVAYARPLLDDTDGSEEQLNKAFAISQFCFNLALLPEDKRDASLGELQRILEMDDKEFDAFRHSIIVPMIQRHHEMFPRMHRRGSADSAQSPPSLPARVERAAPAEKHPATDRYAPCPTDRYAPCPCGSGEKYKFCCGKKGR
jgi:hypothetical protein